MKNKILSILLFITTITALFSNDIEEGWLPLYKGVQYKSITRNKGEIKMHIMKIDATDPEVDIFVTPPRKDGKHTTAFKPSTFLTKHNAQVVINGTGYAPANLSAEGELKMPETLSIYNGKKYAESRGENAFFVVLKNGTKKIIKSEEYPLYEKKISMALGAWPWAGVQGLLIEDGINLVPNEVANDYAAARSALGISTDGKNVYLVLIEGKPREVLTTIYAGLVGQGVTLKDLTAIMQELDCARAINLDGGGSSALVVENTITHKPLILNTPSDHKGERAAGSHLGIKAPYIEGQEQLKLFRKLQESTAYFDLLQKNHSLLANIYEDLVTFNQLSKEDIKTVNELYESFGISPYQDETSNFASLSLENHEFEECFFQNRENDTFCCDPKMIADQLHLKTSSSVLKLSDLVEVGKKPTGYTQGGVYMDSNKVFYYVKDAQSVKNEIIGSRLMNLIFGTEQTPIVMLIEDHPEKIASRMIRGFTMKNAFHNKQNFNTKNKKYIFKDDAALDIASSFLGLIDRHDRNTGYVEVAPQEVVSARADFDHSFAFNSSPVGIPQLFEKNDPCNLLQFYYTFGKYPSKDIIPTLDRILAIPDQQLLMLIVESWVTLSHVKSHFSLEDSFNLANQLIDRKKAFKNALIEIKKLIERSQQNTDQLIFVRDPSQIFTVGNDHCQLIEKDLNKLSLSVNNKEIAIFELRDNKLETKSSQTTNKRYFIDLNTINIDNRSFISINNVRVELKEEKTQAEADRLARENQEKAQRAQAEADRLNRENQEKAQRAQAEAGRLARENQEKAQRARDEKAKKRAERKTRRKEREAMKAIFGVKQNNKNRNRRGW